MRKIIRMASLTLALVGLILSTSCASSKTPTITTNSLPEGTSTTTSITSPTTTTSDNSDSASSSLTNGLSLSLSLDGTTYQPGQEVSIAVDEKNALSTINNVTATTNLPSEFMSGFTNDPSPLPFGLAVLQGNYTLSNYSTGSFFD